MMDHDNLVIKKTSKYFNIESLADTTELIEMTTSFLMRDHAALTAEAGIGIIDQWISLLCESTKTQKIAEELRALKLCWEHSQLMAMQLSNKWVR